MNGSPPIESLLVHVFVWAVLLAFFLLAALVVVEVFAPRVGKLIVGLSS